MAIDESISENKKFVILRLSNRKKFTKWLLFGLLISTLMYFVKLQTKAKNSENENLKKQIEILKKQLQFKDEIINSVKKNNTYLKNEINVLKTNFQESLNEVLSLRMNINNEKKNNNKLSDEIDDLRKKLLEKIKESGNYHSKFEEMRKIFERLRLEKKYCSLWDVFKSFFDTY